MREHLRSCLYLTNPCTKRKVLSLTKPKGKIYKTKSLGHYITNWFVRNKTVWSINYVKINDWCLIELLVIDSNIWNDLTLLSYAKLKCWIERFDHLTVCKQMTCLIELLVIHSNAWNCLTLLTYVYNPIYLIYICINRIWHLLTDNGWYAIKPNQTKADALWLFHHVKRYNLQYLLRTHPDNLNSDKNTLII